MAHGKATFALPAFPSVPFDGARPRNGIPAMLTVQPTTATDCREPQETRDDAEDPDRRTDRKEAAEPARVCQFCHDLGRLKAEGFRCVLCYPQDGDLQGV